MKVAAATVGPLPGTIIKMEDRKRAAGQSVDDLAPPTKRQAMNGGSKVSVDADMPWKDDLELSQTVPDLITILAPHPRPYDHIIS
ncbi:hypothetical protein V498_04033 [Pseudogymnoascus sp. VKM F-4517 (FW-2822)]|nr:hypothetical protein V498_04033 [Pseudogymnoascus sp. VKM F-4517 (FW-2822)]